MVALRRAVHARTCDNRHHGEPEPDQHVKEFVVELPHRRVVLQALLRRRLDGKPLSEDNAYAGNGGHVEREREGGRGHDVKDGLGMQRNRRAIEVPRGELELHDARKAEAGDKRRRRESILETIDDVGNF